MRDAWLINYVEESMPIVALSREKAYELAKDYLKKMWLESETEYYREIALRDLDSSYAESSDGVFGVVGYLSVMRVDLYE